MTAKRAQFLLAERKKICHNCVGGDCRQEGSMETKKIDATLSQAEQADITSKVNAIQAVLAPFSVVLTLTERRSKGRGGDKSRAFILHAAQFALQNANVLRRNFDDAGFQRRVTLLSALEGVSAQLTQLLERVNDTTLELRSQVYKESLAVYKDAKEAGEGGQFDTALAELGKPFAQQGHKKTSFPSQ
jgi:hypothetical protein